MAAQMTMGSVVKVQICFKSTEGHYRTVEKKTKLQNVLMNCIIYGRKNIGKIKPFVDCINSHSH